MEQQEIKMLTEVQQFFEQELGDLAQDASHKAAMLHFEIGQIEDIKDPLCDQALVHCEQSRSKDESYVPCLRALARHYRSQKRWPDTIQVLQTEYTYTDDPLVRSQLLLSIAQIQKYRLSEDTKAIDSLEAATVQDPSNRPALVFLSALYQQAHRWPELLNVYQKMSEQASGEKERARIYALMADITEHHHNKPEEAYQLLCQAAQLDPENQLVIANQERLCYQGQKWSDARTLLLHRIELEQESATQAALCFLAARLCTTKLKDYTQAAALLERAHNLQPDDPLVLWELNQIYLELGKVENQIQVLQSQLKTVQEADQIALLCFQIGQLYHTQLKQPNDAKSWYEKALQHLKWHEASLSALDDILIQLENWQELAQLHLQRAEQALDKSIRAEGYIRAARLFEEKLDEPKRAIDLYTQAYYLVPGLYSAFCSLERLYRQSSNWQALTDLYVNQANINQDEAISSSLLRLAAYTADERLHDANQSLALLAQIDHESQRSKVETAIHQARLHATLADYEELFHDYETLIDLTSDENHQIDLLMHQAELCYARFNEPNRAIVIYKKILEKQPDHRAALRQLTQLYKQIGSTAHYLAMLEQESQLASDKREKVELGYALAQIYKHQEKDKQKAIAILERILAEDNNFSPAIIALAQLYQEANLLDKWISLLSPRFDSPQQSRQLAALYTKAASHLVNQGQDLGQAQYFYNQALQKQSDYMPALLGLEQLYLIQAQYQKLECVQRSLVEQISAVDQKCRGMLRQAATAMFHNEQPSDPVAVYDAVLQLVRNQPEALHAKAFLLRQAQDWQGLALALEHIARYAENRLLRIQALREKSFLSEHGLAQDDQMGRTLERIVKKQPADPYAIAMREMLAYRKKDTQALLTNTLAEIAAENNPVLLRSLYTRACALLVSLGLADKALELLSPTTQADSNHLPSVHWMRKLHEQFQSCPQLSEFLQLESRLVSSPKLYVRACVQAAKLHLQAGLTQEANEMYWAVFQKDPANEVIYEALVKLLISQKDYQQLASVHTQHLSYVTDIQQRNRILLALSALYAQELGDASKQFTVLNQLLEQSPQHRPALEQMVSLCSERGRYRDLENHLAQLAKVTQEDNPTLARQHLLHRSLVLDEYLGESTQALGVLKILLEEDPHDAEVLERYLALLERLEQWQQALAVLDQLIDCAQAEQKIEHILHKAKLFFDPLQDNARCEQEREKALDIALHNALPLDTIIDHYESVSQIQSLVDLLGDLLASSHSYSNQIESIIRTTRAQLLATRLGKTQVAAQEIQRAIELDPDSPSSRLALAWLLRHQQRFEDSLVEYNRLLDKDPFCIQAYRGLSELFGEQADTLRQSVALQIQAVLDRQQELVPQAKEPRTNNRVEPDFFSPAPIQALGLEQYWNNLAHPDEPQIARRLLFEAAPYLSDLLPEVGHDRLSSESQTRVADESLMTQCQTQARLLGVEDFDCVIVDHKPDDLSVWVQPGLPPCLFIPDEFLHKATNGALRFATARALAMVLSRSYFLSSLDQKTIEYGLAALVSLSDRSFGEHLDTDQLSKLTKTAKKIIPRKKRKAIEEIAALYPTQAGIDFGSWRQTAQQSAVRAALFLSLDLASAWQVLENERASAKDKADLLRFALSPQLHTMRKELGL